MLTSSSTHSQAARRHAAFTLVEILVALGIMMILLVVLFVPLRLGFDSFHTGNSRAQVQQAVQATGHQMEEDLRKAIFVFPNTKMPGITDKSPYKNLAGFDEMPYTISNDKDDISQNNSPTYLPLLGVCDVPAAVVSPTPVPTPGSTVASPWRNPSRIDMLLPDTDAATGTVKNPVQVAPYVVTYYPRRLDIKKSFDPITNPMVYYRAQFPYADVTDTPFPAPTPPPAPSGSINADTGSTRYPSGACGANRSKLNRNSIWLAHNYYGEANLEPLCQDAGTDVIVGSHTLASPRDMSLVAPGGLSLVAAAGTGSLQPSSSFICEDTDSDGKIDRVTINLLLAQYDGNGQINNGVPTGQKVGYSQAVDLPNVH